MNALLLLSLLTTQPWGSGMPVEDSAVSASGQVGRAIDMNNYNLTEIGELRFNIGTRLISAVDGLLRVTQASAANAAGIGILIGTADANGWKLTWDSAGLGTALKGDGTAAGLRLGAAQGLLLGTNARITSGGADSANILNGAGNAVATLNVKDFASVTASDLGATCAVGDLKVDNGGATVELCFCSALNTWKCGALAAGPTD